MKCICSKLFLYFLKLLIWTINYIKLILTFYLSLIKISHSYFINKTTFHSQNYPTYISKKIKEFINVLHSAFFPPTIFSTYNLFICHPLYTELYISHGVHSNRQGQDDFIEAELLQGRQLSKWQCSLCSCIYSSERVMKVVWIIS